MSQRIGWILGAMALALMLAPAAWGQAYTQCRIIYASMQDGTQGIYSVKPDGSDQRLLIADASDPAVSPDGRTIAFVRGRDIYVARADGSHQRAVTKHGLGVQVAHPAFSADGQRIVFAMGPVVPNPVMNIRLVNIDGTGERTVAEDGRDPIYTPDGVVIMFARNGDIYSMLTNAMGGPPYTPAVMFAYGPGVVAGGPMYAPDGSQIVYTLTPVAPDAQPSIYTTLFQETRVQKELAKNAAQPAVSPDSQRIAFTRDGDIYLMNADGSHQVQLTTGPAADSSPAWLCPAVGERW